MATELCSFHHKFHMAVMSVLLKVELRATSGSTQLHDLTQLVQKHNNVIPETYFSFQH
jgi:hypothetical protein